MTMAPVIRVIRQLREITLTRESHQWHPARNYRIPRYGKEDLEALEVTSTPPAIRSVLMIVLVVKEVPGKWRDDGER